MLMPCWAAVTADADDAGDSDARRRRLIRQAAEECELRGGKSCVALARRRLKCASAWCCVGRGGAVGGDASAVTCGGRPAARSPRRGEELGGKSTSGGWTANGGNWAQDCGVAGDLERLLLLLRCLRRRQLKRGYLRMREASGDMRLDGPERAVGEREAKDGSAGGVWVCKRVRAGARA